jgi:hypothetical protein
MTCKECGGKLDFGGGHAPLICLSNQLERVKAENAKLREILQTLYVPGRDEMDTYLVRVDGDWLRAARQALGKDQG